MQQHTIEAIQLKVREIWRDEDGWRPLDVEVTNQVPDEVRIRISRMYDAPGLDLSRLMQLAEFFGSKNINDDERFSESGCETCDYGSCYGFELVVRSEAS